LHDALLREQKYVCCYCGGAITRDDSHIEHFNPQTKARNLEIYYPNLYASCIRELKPTMPIHCGHAKKAEFDENLVISPQDEGCESRYSYGLNGTINIVVQDDAKALYMLKLLNLSNVSLVNRRQNILKAVFDDEFIAAVTKVELIALAQNFREAVEGRLSDFGHVVARFAERLAEPDAP